MVEPRPCPACKAWVTPQVAANGALRCPRCGALGKPVVFRTTAPPGAPRPRRRAGTALLGLLAAGLLVTAALLAYSALAPAPGSDPVPVRTHGRVLDGSRPVAPAVDANDTYHREYSWDYGGKTWTFTLNIPGETYRYFHDADRPARYVDDGGSRYRQMAYDVFVTTPLDDLYMDELAQKLSDAAHQQGWSSDETLSFALSFVQSLPYTSDDVTTGFDEYPRFPIETLVDDGGDCEDTSILYASLVSALDYGAVLLSPPGHMAVGVATSSTSSASYTFDGKHYLYAETTGDGWELGEVPKDYDGQGAQVFDLVPKPLFELGVEYADVIRQSQLDVDLNATAIGSATAAGIEIWSGVEVGGNRFLDTKSCHVGSLAPGQRASCHVRLDLSKVSRGQSVRIVSRVQDAQFWYAQQESEPWVPRP